MTNISTTSPALQSEAETTVHLLDNWFDAIEVGLRERVREFIQAMIESELETALARPRYCRRPTADVQNGDGPKGVSGYRHGHRSRSLIGTFGRVEIALPRARLDTAEGKTTEWKSSALRAYQRRTQQADSLIAGAYLAGTNTRRVRRALSAVFGGAVSKDTVSRVWRKVKGDWDAWNARSLAEEPMIRLILDGTVVRVRLDRKATAIVLLVVLGVRRSSLIEFPDHYAVTRLSETVTRHGQAQARVPDRRRRHWAGASPGRPLGRRADATLHGPQAPQSAGSRTPAPE